MAGRIQAEGALQQAVADLQTVNRELQSEILERRRSQEKLQGYLRFLEVVHQQTDMKSLLEAFVAEIRSIPSARPWVYEYSRTRGRFHTWRIRDFHSSFVNWKVL